MSEKLEPKKLVGCALAMAGLLVTMPIWYWLVYQVLVRVNATPTMWVFYWIYTPVSILLFVAKTLIDNLFSDD